MDKTLIYVGAGAVALYLFTRSSGTALTTSTTPAPLATAAPGTVAPANAYFTDATGHQVTVQPTAAQNAGLTDPNYQMSPTELSAYYNNYLDLQQGMKDWIPKYGTLNAALQAHWEQAGCSDKRTFLPLYTKSTVAYVPPPANGGGGGWLSIAGDAVSVITALAGVGSVSNYTDRDVEVIINSSQVAKEILPFFRSDSKYSEISNNIDQTLHQILS